MHRDPLKQARIEQSSVKKPNYWTQKPVSSGNPEELIQTVKRSHTPKGNKRKGGFQLCDDCFKKLTITNHSGGYICSMCFDNSEKHDNKHVIS